jgi:hypothetical protein
VANSGRLVPFTNFGEKSLVKLKWNPEAMSSRSTRWLVSAMKWIVQIHSGVSTQSDGLSDCSDVRHRLKSEQQTKVNGILVTDIYVHNSSVSGDACKITRAGIGYPCS